MSSAGVGPMWWTRRSEYRCAVTPWSARVGSPRFPEIRLLLPGDYREGFTSKDEALDRYLRLYAGQNQFRHRIGVNYVAIMEGRVTGYASVSPANIEFERLPPTLAKRLPRYPLPVLRLARLATDRRVRGQGVGLELLRYVFGLAHQMSGEFGCVGVLVDAKAPAVAFYGVPSFSVQ